MNFWESFYRGLKELAGTPIGVLYLTMLTMFIIYTLKGIYDNLIRLLYMKTLKKNVNYMAELCIFAHVLFREKDDNMEIEETMNKCSREHIFVGFLSDLACRFIFLIEIDSKTNDVIVKYKRKRDSQDMCLIDTSARLLSKEQYIDKVMDDINLKKLIIVKIFSYFARKRVLTTLDHNPYKIHKIQYIGAWAENKTVALNKLDEKMSEIKKQLEIQREELKRTTERG